jgi:hypothetical protein
VHVDVVLAVEQRILPHAIEEAAVVGSLSLAGK